MIMNKDFLEVRESLISGKGVFAKKGIKKGVTICFMNGKVHSLREMIVLVDSGLDGDSDPLGIDDETYMDLDELYRCINHSCSPNAFLRGKNELVALKNIKKGDEITYDYSTTMNDNKEVIEEDGDELWTEVCCCKSKNCRGIIDQFKTLPKKVQEFYIKNKFAPDFILRRFS